VPMLLTGLVASKNRYVLDRDPATVNATTG
jgi:hypothetical protein